MSASLKDQIQALISIQELDLKIRQLDLKKADLPEALKAANEKIDAIKKEMNSRKAKLADFQKLKGQTLAALDMNRDRLTRSAQRLESITNNEEFQAVTKENDQLKKMLAQLEAQSEKFVADFGGIEKEMAEFSDQLKEAQAELKVKSDETGSLGSGLNSEIKTIESEKSVFSATVAQVVLTKYERIRKSREGVGIVPTVSGRCTGCNMMVPPRILNEMLKGKEVQSCMSCQRLLFQA